MEEVEQWARLAELLGADDEAIAAVRRADLEGDALEDALFDGLDAAGALAYLRSTDTGMELADALAQLPRVFAAGAAMDDAADVDELQEAARSADASLTRIGLQLLSLGEEDDAWSLVVVPSGAAEEALALAARLEVELSPLR